MTGTCYIDGKDIYIQFGVIITQGGYNDFLTFPAIQEPDKTDWAEENGIEVDLSEVILQPREINVSFAVIAGQNWRGFYEMLAVPGYRKIEIPALEKSWTLRVVEMPAFEDFFDGSLFEIKFIEDIPARVTSYPAANTDIGLPCVLSLDGKTLDKYGIVVEAGLSELQRRPNLKHALTRTSSLVNGQVYDTRFVRFAEKEVTFNCCFISIQIVDFWQLYNAFFGDLTKPGLRTLSLYEKSYEAYYRKSGNFDLIINPGEVFCHFDVTLVINKEL